ncbi:MAG: hypothetical protein U9R08_05225 [Nanoarchaeota archaeon]|nr:hypothetical protein [Nanoarchaeota archaeon]
MVSDKDKTPKKRSSQGSTSTQHLTDDTIRTELAEKKKAREEQNMDFAKRLEQMRAKAAAKATAQSISTPKGQISESDKITPKPTSKTPTPHKKPITTSNSVTSETEEEQNPEWKYMREAAKNKSARETADTKIWNTNEPKSNQILAKEVYESWFRTEYNQNDELKLTGGLGELVFDTILDENGTLHNPFNQTELDALVNAIEYKIADIKRGEQYETDMGIISATKTNILEVFEQYCKIYKIKTEAGKGKLYTKEALEALLVVSAGIMYNKEFTIKKDKTESYEFDREYRKFVRAFGPEIIDRAAEDLEDRARSNSTPKIKSELAMSAARIKAKRDVIVEEYRKTFKQEHKKRKQKNRLIIGSLALMLATGYATACFRGIVPEKINLVNRIKERYGISMEITKTTTNTTQQPETLPQPTPTLETSIELPQPDDTPPEPSPIQKTNLDTINDYKTQVKNLSTALCELTSTFQGNTKNIQTRSQDIRTDYQNMLTDPANTEPERTELQARGLGTQLDELSKLVKIYEEVKIYRTKTNTFAKIKNIPRKEWDRMAVGTEKTMKTLKKEISTMPDSPTTRSLGKAIEEGYDQIIGAYDNIKE